LRDTGRLLENVVFLELMRREGDVFVGQGVGGEIDFITNGAGGPPILSGERIRARLANLGTRTVVVACSKG